MFKLALICIIYYWSQIGSLISSAQGKYHDIAKYKIILPHLLLSQMHDYHFSLLLVQPRLWPLFVCLRLFKQAL